MKNNLFFLSLSVSCFFSIVALAQNFPVGAMPAAGTQRMRESIEGYQRERQIQGLQKVYQERQKQKQSDKQGAEKEKENSSKPIMTLETLEFDKSSVLEPVFLDKVKQQYECHKISLDDVKKIVETVNEEYKSKGYLTSRAYIPAQDVKEGTLKIGLFEGKVGSLIAAENTLTTKEYIETYLNIPSGSVLNVSEVEKKVLLFNAGNDAKARVALQAGKEKGTTDIETIVEDPQRVQMTAFTDNAGQKETGYYRGGVFASARGIIPSDMIRDQLNIGGVGSTGSKSFFGSYAITEPFWGTTWTLGTDWSDTDIVGGDLRGLDIEGNFYNYYLSVKKPVWVTEQSVTNLSLTGAIKKGATYISEFKTQETNTDTLTGALDNLYFFNRGYLYNQVAATRAARINVGESKFWHYNYMGEAQVGFLEVWAINVKGRAQYSKDDFLPSSDQFQVGGVNSVRGYPEGMLVGDSGFSLMNEVKRELQVKIPKVQRTEVFTFYDIGKAYSAESGDLKNTNEALIYSAGFGTRVDFLDRLNASLTAAFPLKRHEFNHDRKGVKFLFYVQAKLW